MFEDKIYISEVNTEHKFQGCFVEQKLRKIIFFREIYDNACSEKYKNFSGCFQ